MYGLDLDHGSDFENNAFHHMLHLVMNVRKDSGVDSADYNESIWKLAHLLALHSSKISRWPVNEQYHYFQEEHKKDLDNAMDVLAYWSTLEKPVYKYVMLDKYNYTDTQSLPQMSLGIAVNDDGESYYSSPNVISNPRFNLGQTSLVSMSVDSRTSDSRKQDKKEDTMREKLWNNEKLIRLSNSGSIF